jgi:hypothetical protein
MRVKSIFVQAVLAIIICVLSIGACLSDLFSPIDPTSTKKLPIGDAIRLLSNYKLFDNEKDLSVTITYRSKSDFTITLSPSTENKRKSLPCSIKIVEKNGAAKDIIYGKPIATSAPKQIALTKAFAGAIEYEYREGSQYLPQATFEASVEKDDHNQYYPKSKYMVFTRYIKIGKVIIQGVGGGAMYLLDANFKVTHIIPGK